MKNKRYYINKLFGAFLLSSFLLGAFLLILILVTILIMMGFGLYSIGESLLQLVLTI